MGLLSFVFKLVQLLHGFPSAMRAPQLFALHASCDGSTAPKTDLLFSSFPSRGPRHPTAFSFFPVTAPSPLQEAMQRLHPYHALLSIHNSKVQPLSAAARLPMVQLKMTWQRLCHPRPSNGSCTQLKEKAIIKIKGQKHEKGEGEVKDKGNGRVDFF